MMTASGCTSYWSTKRKSETATLLKGGSSEAAEQGSSSEQRFEFVAEFMQTLNDIAEKFAMARGPDSMCPVLELGTELQRRHKFSNPEKKNRYGVF